MTQEEFDRVVAIAKEKRHCDDIVFPVGITLAAVEYERERCAKIAEEIFVHDAYWQGKYTLPQAIAKLIRDGKL